MNVDSPMRQAASGRGSESALDDPMRGQFRVDLSGNQRIPLIMELVGAVSRATTPQEIYRRWRDGINQLSGHAAYLALSTRELKPGEYRITHFEPRGEEDRVGHDPWRNFRSLPVLRGGFLGELIRSTWPALVNHLDVRDDSAIGAMLAPYRSMVAVPIFDRGEPLNWSIMLSDEREHYSVAQLEEILLRANMVGGMTKNAVISQQLREANGRIEREVRHIAGIQRALLPDPLPEVANVRLAASYKTSEQAGGDSYDLIPLDFQSDGTPRADGRWIIVISDASGHGPAAAVVMAMFQAIMRALAERFDRPGELLAHANRHLAAKRIEGSFVTAWVGVLNASTRELAYARAGHNPPLLKTGPVVERLDHVGGIPLGIDAASSFEEHSIRLHAGQTLVLYTDGVTDAMDASSNMFGVKGIEEALECCTGEPECSVGSINQAVEAHQRDSAIRDDQTIVAMRFD